MRARAGTLAETLQSAGYRGAVAAPVLVGGRLWGALAAGTRSPESLPDGARTAPRATSPSWSRRRSPTPTRTSSSPPRARGSSSTATPSGARLKHNLHDGAQQRLVSVAIDLRVISAHLAQGSREGESEQLSAAQEQLAQGLDDLRELARGIHPAVLTDRGLGPVARVARRSARRCRSRSPSCPRSASRARSRRPRTTSSPRRSRTSPSTRRPRTRPSACVAPTGARRSRSPTTASAARTPRGARACAASPTASRRSTGASTWRARPRAGPGSGQKIPCG